MSEDGLVSGHSVLSQTKLHLGHSFVWTHIFSESSQVPRTRAKHATCFHNGAIYLYGGISGNVSLKDMWRFEVASHLWAKLEYRGEAPPLLKEHTMVGHKDSLYIFGGLCGFDNPGETALWMLDLASLTWGKQTIESEVMTPANRRGHSVVTHQGAMHLFGGHVDLKGSCSELWTLDFESMYWHTTVYSSQDPVPPARHNHSAVVHQGSMYIYGGLSNLQPLRDMWKWNFRKRSWTRVRYWQGPPALQGHSAVTLGDSMMVYGGEDSSGTSKSDLWVFSYSSESWTKMPYKGSIIPSPTIHHTLEMDIPDSDSLLTPPEERSISAPFLQRPSMSSLHVAPLPRPHSSPAYSTNAQSKALKKERAFRNRVHPSTPPGGVAPTSHGSYTNPPVEVPSSDDDDDDYGSDGTEDDGEGDLYDSRIFIPVSEFLNSSSEKLLMSGSVERDLHCAKGHGSKVTPEDPGRDKGRRRSSPSLREMSQASSSGDASLTELKGLDRNHAYHRKYRGHSLHSLPKVMIEDFDTKDTSLNLSQGTHMSVRARTLDRDTCNNHRSVTPRPQVLHVLPKSYSDEIPLLPVNGTVDDINMNQVYRSHEGFAFVNKGFTSTDSLYTQSRPRSNSLTSLHRELENIRNSAEDKHQSLIDLPNMARLILRRRESSQKSRNLESQEKNSRATKSRPKLRKCSQTDHALYQKTQDYSGTTSPEVGKGKGRFHLPVPVHLYVLGGQEPNVSSLHMYQTPLPVFRCTIVPGKPSKLEIQALLY